MKNKEVCKEFIRRRVASGSNLVSTGDKLFSYNTCIAQFNGHALILNETKYSVTTSKHQSYLRKTVTDSGIWATTYLVDNVNYNTRDLVEVYERIYRDY